MFFTFNQENIETVQEQNQKQKESKIKNLDLKNTIGSKV